MAKVVRCKDLGMACEFVARGQNEQEVMGKLAEHARAVHDMKEIPPEIAQKAKAAMRDE